MQIGATLLRGLLTGITNQTTKSSDENVASSQKKAATSDSGTLNALLDVGSSSQAVSWQEILKDYDLSDITPQQFSKMLQRLRDANLIDDKDFASLSLVRSDLAEAGIESNESVDLLAFYRRFIHRLQMTESQDASTASASASARLEQAQKNLQWLEKVTTLQSESQTDSWA